MLEVRLPRPQQPDVFDRIRRGMKAENGIVGAHHPSDQSQIAQGQNAQRRKGTHQIAPFPGGDELVDEVDQHSGQIQHQIEENIVRIRRAAIDDIFHDENGGQQADDEGQQAAVNRLQRRLGADLAAASLLRARNSRAARRV